MKNKARNLRPHTVHNLLVKLLPHTNFQEIFLKKNFLKRFNIKFENMLLQLRMKQYETSK